MAKVDENGEMVSDDPETAAEEERGGRQAEDMPTDANPTGSGAPSQRGMTP